MTKVPEFDAAWNTNTRDTNTRNTLPKSACAKCLFVFFSLALLGGCASRPASFSENDLDREFQRLAAREKRAVKKKRSPVSHRFAIREIDLSSKLDDSREPWMILESTSPTGFPQTVLNPRAQASFTNSTSRFKAMKPESLNEELETEVLEKTLNAGESALDRGENIKIDSESKQPRQKVDEAHLIFDFPVTYNARVRKWIRYFQTTGRPSFRRWLERSTRYIPYIQSELKRARLPTDIAYVAMIESGFAPSAVSHAHAMGMWQFIAPTGQRYGLAVDWWIDERRDFEKSTRAAIGYMSDLFEQFGSWYLVAASYNMGEGGVRRLIQRHKTNSFWDLADRGALPDETRNYLPKMLAAMLIAKAPALYGFRDLDFQLPFTFELYDAPGGTDLIALASYLGVSERSITELNPELLKAFIPREIKTHRIRIPKGSKNAVAQFLSTH